MSRVSLEREREQKFLKVTKKIEFWRSIWRALVISCLALSLFWSISLPKWTIADRSQIQIQGSRLVSSETIYSLLPLSYPHSIWQIHTKKLSRDLSSTPPILNAKITRQLFPPRLIVTVEERVPVALAVEDGRVGFLDKNGIWVARNFYQNLKSSSDFPTLKVVGFERQYRDLWSDLYHLITDRSMTIFEVNWQDPTNLILKTELGSVRLGSSLVDLSKKFAVLDRLRELPTHFEKSEIVYIDLTNPDSPLIQRMQKIKPPANIQ